MTAAAVQERERSAGEKAALSRVINQAIEVDDQIKELSARLKDLKNQIYDLAGGPGTFRGNKGYAEIKEGTVLTLPKDSEERLRELLGDRYVDLVDEGLSLKAKDGLRRLVFEPGPAERDVSAQLKDIVKVRDQVSITLKSAA